MKGRPGLGDSAGPPSLPSPLKSATDDEKASERPNKRPDRLNSPLSAISMDPAAQEYRVCLTALPGTSRASGLRRQLICAPPQLLGIAADRRRHTGHLPPPRLFTRVARVFAWINRVPDCLAKNLTAGYSTCPIAYVSEFVRGYGSQGRLGDVFPAWGRGGEGRFPRPWVIPGARPRASGGAGPAG
jgi:hypothetical protein